MTEAEWESSEDPAALLRHLDVIYEPGIVSEPGFRPKPKISDRKMRLFACACCRHIWEWLAPNYSKRIIDAAEGFADGAAPWSAVSDSGRKSGPGVECLRMPEADAGARAAAALAAQHYPAVLPAYAALLRGIAGNPFMVVERRHRHGSGDGSVISARKRNPAPGERLMVLAEWWLTDDVRRLARAAYDERLPDGTLDPARLLVLADALEEAGCAGDICQECKGEGKTHWRARDDEEDRWFRYTTHAGYRREDWMEKCEACGGAGRLPHALLEHLRSPGPHYRGMWSLDLVLGKE